MGKNSGAAAQRAKKKHEREQKRKKAQAERQRTARQRLDGKAAAAQIPSWRPEEESIAGFAARAKLAFHIAAHAASIGAAQKGAALPEAAWTLPRVAGLTTEDLVARLARLGIETDRESFTAATPRIGSAVGWAEERWLGRLGAEADRYAADFVRLAAAELWKRWRAEPSEEIVLDRAIAMESSIRLGDPVTATREGIALWGALRGALGADVRTTVAIERQLGPHSEGLIFNWASDFSIAAQNAAHHAGSEDKGLTAEAAAALGEVVDQFRDESEGWRLPLIQDRGLLLWESGAREEGDRILRELIATRPDEAGAYVTLAHALGHSADRADLERAIGLLEEAAARPVKDAESWDLPAQIEHLRELLEEARAAG
jgi:hypothetical protein